MGMKVAGRGRFNNEAEEFARFAGRWASKERRESEKEVRGRERERRGPVENVEDNLLLLRFQGLIETRFTKIKNKNKRNY